MLLRAWGVTPRSAHRRATPNTAFACGSVAEIARYREFLPGGQALEVLTAAVRGYVGDEQAWDLQLVLAREDVPLPLMGQGQRIGLSLWLGHYRRPRDADQLVLAPS